MYFYGSSSIMLLISFDFQSCVMKPHLLWLPLHWRSYSISTGCQKGFFVSFFLSWFTEFCNSASLWFSWSVISASQTRKSAVGSVNFLKGKLPTFTQMGAPSLNKVGWLMTWGNHVLSYLKWKEEKNKLLATFSLNLVRVWDVELMALDAPNDKAIVLPQK